MPVEFANSARMNRDDRRGNRGGHFKLAGIHDAHLPALRALRDRLLHGAKRKIVRRRPQRSRRDSLILRERTRNLRLKNEEFFLGHFFQGLLADAEILREDIARRVRHPVREKHGRIFRKVAVVEDQQEFGAVRIQSLNRMRNSGRKIPEISFFHVGHEAAAVGINRGDPRVSVEHDGPLAGRVPVQFADAACGEPHIHARDRRRDRQFAHRYLARPAAGVQPFVRQRERVLERLHAASVRARRKISNPDSGRRAADWWGPGSLVFRSPVGWAPAGPAPTASAAESIAAAPTAAPPIPGNLAAKTRPSCCSRSCFPS